MVNIDDEVGIINHQILRYIRAGENNRKYSVRRLSFIRFEPIEYDILLLSVRYTRTSTLAVKVAAIRGSTVFQNLEHCGTLQC